MLKFIKSFFIGKPAESAAPYKVETPADTQPVVNNPGVDAVSVALDLEGSAPVAEKPAKVKKPRAPKAEKPAAKKAPAKAKAPKAAPKAKATKSKKA